MFFSLTFTKSLSRKLFIIDSYHSINHSTNYWRLNSNITNFIQINSYSTIFNKTIFSPNIKLFESNFDPIDTPFGLNLNQNRSFSKNNSNKVSKISIGVDRPMMQDQTVNIENGNIQDSNTKNNEENKLLKNKKRRSLPPVEEDKWYHKNKDLLRFSCTQCGKCCTGAPGVVYVTVRDIVRMARRLKMKVDDFCAQHVRVVMNSKRRTFFALKEIKREGKYDCIFLENGKCKVYLERPAQCWTYPFWSNVVESEESWNEEKEYCEGIGRGEPIDPREADRLVKIDSQGREDAAYTDDIEDLAKYYELEIDEEEEQERRRFKLLKENEDYQVEIDKILEDEDIVEEVESLANKLQKKINLDDIPKNA